MTKSDRQRADDAAADLKRMQDWSQQPGVDSRSTGDGVERNARLRQIDEANKNSSRPSDQDWDTVPGADEARERFLTPSVARLAQEAAEFTPEPIRHPRWLRWAIVVSAVVLFYALAYRWLWPWAWEGRP